MPADPVALRDAYHRLLYAESCCVPIPSFPFRFATWAHVCGGGPAGAPAVAPAELAGLGDVYAFQHPSPPLGPRQNWFEPLLLTRYSLLSGLRALAPGWVRTLSTGQGRDARGEPGARGTPGSRGARGAQGADRGGCGDCTEDDMDRAYAAPGSGGSFATIPDSSRPLSAPFGPPPGFAQRVAARGLSAAVADLDPEDFVGVTLGAYLALLEETQHTYAQRGRSLGRTAADLERAYAAPVVSFLVQWGLLAPDGARNLHVVLPGSNWALSLLRASWELLCSWLLRSEAGVYHWGFTSRYLQRLPDFAPFRGDLPRVDFGFCFGAEFHLLALDGRNVACVSNEGGTLAVIGDYCFEA